MAFKNSFLANFLGVFSKKSDPNSVTQDSPNEPNAEVESIPVQMQPAETPRFKLELPVEHPVNKLRSKFREQGGRVSLPWLELVSPDTLDMSVLEMQSELTRFQSTINTTSTERFRKIEAGEKVRAEAIAKNTNATGDEPDSILEPPFSMDAQAVVFTSSTNLVSWVVVYPPVGNGLEVNKDILSAALEDKGVRYGINDSILESIPESEDRYFHVFTVAVGKRAVNGADGHIIDLFPRQIERKVAIDEENKADYANLGVVTNVNEGDTICKIIPPADGTPGRTVTDLEIPAKNGKPASPPKGRNTEISEDGTQLIATHAGHLEFSGRSFLVKPLLDIPGNVDYSTGNINYLGDVHIHGDICAGFTVRAMGSITVDGVVEACSIEAGSDLVVAKGIQGDNQAVIRAQRNMYAKFLENCCIYVKDSLHTDSIINCDVYCDGSIEVRSGRMTVMGGKIRAAHEVSAGTIGSRSECRTDVFIGGLPCSEFDNDLLRREISKLEEELAKLEKQPDGPTKLSRISKGKVQLMMNRNKLDQLNKDKELLAESPPDPGLRRMKSDVVYPGTQLTIGNQSYRFDRETRPCNATVFDGELHLI